MKVYFVTNNANKLKETRQILGDDLDHIELDIAEIQSMDITNVAMDKARKAYEHVRKPVIVEDIGLYLNAMNGFPGTLIKWMIRTVGEAGICGIVRNSKDKGAYAQCCYAFFDGMEMRAFLGRVDGRISESPRGRSGFDWDQIFIPLGYEMTFAEMETEQKNKISPRRIALEKLREYLSKRRQ